MSTWIEDAEGCLHWGQEVSGPEPGQVFRTVVRDELARFVSYRSIPEYYNEYDKKTTPAHTVMDVIWLPNTSYDKESPGSIPLTDGSKIRRVS